MTYQIFKDVDETIRWRLILHGCRAIAQSAEPYNHVVDRQNAISLVKGSLHAAVKIDLGNNAHPQHNSPEKKSSGTGSGSA